MTEMSRINREKMDVKDLGISEDNHNKNSYSLMVCNLV